MGIGSLAVKGITAAAEREAKKAAARAVKKEVAPAVEKAVARTVRKPAAKPPLAVVRPAAPAIIKARSGQPLAVAQDVLQEAAKPSKGRPGFTKWREGNPENGLLFDLSNLSRVPDVPQYQIPRYQPPRGPSARIVDALSNPDVERGINETVERGLGVGGMDWYNTEPVFERMGGIMPSIDAPSEYAAFMDIMAATSPRAKVTDNVRTGSYYNYLRANGLPIPEKPAKGYGHLAQKSHRDHARQLEQLGGWDIFKNPKPASFSSNLQGNQAVTTIDTHNFRLPGILAGDPRMLETSVKAGTKGTRDATAEALARRYPTLPEEEIMAAVKGVPVSGAEDLATYRPQQWVNSGHMSIEDALNDPVLWAAKPKDNEYGYYEKWQQDQARDKFGISPAQYQASMWLGGGEDTGLGSAAEPFTAGLEARMRYTADHLGMDPAKVRDMMLKGEIPLLADGGPVRRKSLAVDMDIARRR